MKITALLLGAALLSPLALAQTKPAPQPEPAAKTETAPPDTASVIKARFAAYKLQQKEAMKLAKLQTQLSLEQLKYQQATTKASRKIAIEQAKAR